MLAEGNEEAGAGHLVEHAKQLVPADRTCALTPNQLRRIDRAEERLLSATAFAKPCVRLEGKRCACPVDPLISSGAMHVLALERELAAAPCTAPARKAFAETSPSLRARLKPAARAENLLKIGGEAFGEPAILGEDPREPQV